MVMMSVAQLRRPPSGDYFPRRVSAGMADSMDRMAARLDQGSAGDLVTLLAAVAGGDRRALATLYARTSAKLYGICLRLLGSEQDAQDALHDAYLTVWRNAARFDPAKASAITWLAVLTRNKAIDRLRQRRRPMEQIEAAADLHDESPSAIELIENSQERGRLAQCLEQLDDRAGTLIRAAFFSGSTYSELAGEKGVPLGTMKSWIRRGLAKLRGCLEQ